MKKVIYFITIALLTVTLVGCNALDPLSQFVDVSNNNLSTIESFEEVEAEDEFSINQLISQQTIQLSLSLSTDQEQINNIRTLFQEIRVLHANNVINANEVKMSYQILRDNVQTFKSLDIKLISEDITEIREARRLLISQRSTIMENRGVVFDLFQELRGKYNVENLDLIINNLESIKVILEQRASYIVLVGEKISDVNLIVESYLS
jgi:hypothetical protein